MAIVKIVFKQPTNTVFQKDDEIMIEEKLISEKGLTNLVSIYRDIPKEKKEVNSK